MGAGEGMEKTVLGRGNSMYKKRELDFLRELTVVLCRTGNHVAERHGEGKRAPRDKGLKEPFTPR